MTGLKKWRKVAQGLTIVSFMGGAALSIVSLVGLLFIAARSDAPVLDRFISVVVMLGLYGVALWAVCDARRRRRLPSSDRLGGTGNSA